MSNKYYASNGSDGTKLLRDCDIEVFNSEADAKAFLLEPYKDDPYYDCNTAVFADGSFGDCWIEVYDAPRVGEQYMSPYTYNDLIISKPGTHPGGNCYWITPYDGVLVLESIQLRNE